MATDSLIKVTYRGIDRQIRRMRLAHEVIEDPRITPVINAVADVWKINFDTEGSLVGGWRELSEVTQRVRQSRGFNPQRPILEQYGQLRYAAVEALSRVTTESLNVSADGAHMSYTSGKNRAELTITGRKVANQFRNRSRDSRGRRMSSPPRRFWFVNDQVIKAAQQALVKSVKEELRGSR